MLRGSPALGRVRQELLHIDRLFFHRVGVDLPDPLVNHFAMLVVLPEIGGVSRNGPGQ